MDIYKDIIGWEGLYQIGSNGMVKYLNYLHHEGKEFCSPGLRLNNGYMKTTLKKKGRISQQVLIHRLVADAFIPNPDNKPQVNHKNGIKDDNRVENLEWVTEKENTRHSLKNGFSKQRLTGVIGTNIKDGSIIEFESIQDAADYVNGNRSNIHKCLKGNSHRTIAYGYTWRYAHISHNLISKVLSPLSQISL